MVSPEGPKSDAISAEQLADLKRAELARLMAMPPDEAQAVVESILHPRLWKIADPRQLAWPGDLADDLAGESADESGEDSAGNVEEGFDPRELAEVSCALQAAGWEAVVVGQAVNVWACPLFNDRSRPRRRAPLSDASR